MYRFILIGVVLFAAGCGDKNASFIKSEKCGDSNITTLSAKLVDALKSEGFELIKSRSNVISKPNSANREQSITEFSKPKDMQMLLVCNPTLGLDLPFKIEIHKSYEGKTELNYINPEYLSLTHNIKDKACIELINRSKISIEKAVAQAIK